MKFIYQVVTNRGTRFLDREMLLNEFEVRGINYNDYNREELQGQPKLIGLLGPMYNGFDDKGNTVIRYESQAYYDNMV